MTKALLLAVLVLAGLLVPGSPAYAGDPIINCVPTDGGTCDHRSDCTINVETGATTCSRDAGARALVGTVTHAMLFTEPSFRGHTLRYVSDRACTPDKSTVEYGDPSFDDPFWDDEFESVRIYNGCRIELFRSENYDGGSTDLIDDEWADFGTGDDWADNVSSIKMY